MTRVAIAFVSLGVVLAAAGVACKPKGDTAEPHGDVASGVKQIGAGTDYTAALYNDGYARVIGVPKAGQKGIAREVDFGGKVARIATGRDHACVELESGKVKCVGRNSWGGLGYGNTEKTTAETAEDLDLGGKIVDLSAGHGYSCAVLEDGTARCWGSGQGGRLGYGNRDDVLSATKAGPVPVGGPVRDIETGSAGVTCAVLESGAVRCWGQNLQGVLGYGTAKDVGDDETPADVGDVALPGKAVQLAIGAAHVCAVIEGGTVRCWGFGAEGRLGYDADGNVGDGETPKDGKDVDIGGPVSAIAAGDAHTCALLTTGAVRCWGIGRNGRLGYGSDEDIGQLRSPAQAGDVAIGGKAKLLAAGPAHTCALLESGDTMCWGDKFDGATTSAKPVKVSFADAAADAKKK
jgi:alpha-tubulin suppressor-like RCC1 family protein